MRRMRYITMAVRKVLRRLKKRYPDKKVSLYHRQPFQLLIATILSAQCTDKKVNEVSRNLFKRYKGIKDFAAAQVAVIEKQIYSTGFYRHKARNIIDTAKMVSEDFHGHVPTTMSDLTMLPGVGRKTANIVLSGAFHKAEGIAVDTHVKRISQRLGFSREKEPDKIERDLLKVVPRKDWLDFNYILVTHGRQVCKAQRPLCGVCVVNDFCPARRQLNV